MRMPAPIILFLLAPAWSWPKIHPGHPVSRMKNEDHGNVPHGILVGEARKVLIANLTIKDVYYHPIQMGGNPFCEEVRIHHCRLVNAGEPDLPVDFDGKERPAGQGCDAGAFEFGS